MAKKRKEISEKQSGKEFQSITQKTPITQYPMNVERSNFSFNIDVKISADAKDKESLQNITDFIEKLKNLPKSKISELAMANLRPLNQSQLELFEEMIPTVLTNRRAPCAISRVMGDTKCLDIFYHMLIRIGKPPHEELHGDKSPGGAAHPPGSQDGGGQQEPRRPDAGDQPANALPEEIFEPLKSWDIESPYPFVPIIY